MGDEIGNMIITIGKKNKDTAFVVVDMQNGFCQHGALPVSGGDSIVSAINKMLPMFGIKVASLDCHPKEHCSFVENGGQWPVYCVMGTSDAEFHPNLDVDSFTVIVKKGVNKDREAYSAFDGTELEKYLKRHGIKKVFIAGLALDFCVKETALDALKLGFEVFVVSNATKAVDPEKEKNVLEELEKEGISVVKYMG